MKQILFAECHIKDISQSNVSLSNKTNIVVSCNDQLLNQWANETAMLPILRFIYI